MSEVVSFDRIKTVVNRLLDRHSLKSASVFGSYARGEATSDSDIDILVYAGEGFRPADVFGMAEDLYEALGKKVDVFEASELLPGTFKDTVLREAVAL